MSVGTWNIIVGSALSFTGIVVVFLLNQIANYLNGISKNIQAALLVQAEHTIKLNNHGEAIKEHKEEIKAIKVEIKNMQLQFK